MSKSKFISEFIFLSLILILLSSMPIKQSKLLKSHRNNYQKFINFILQEKGLVQNMEIFETHKGNRTVWATKDIQV
jgi:hypothetical protein